MKKPNLKKIKLFSEFKEFITRGNVMGLAIGMIIGAAFTAIVNAVVNSIFKPLINAIPMNGINGLITMLVAKDANGVVTENPALIDLTQSVYIDWGAFIMAVLNFFITAIILFAILKAVTSVQKGFGGLKGELDLITGEEYAQLKAEGHSRKEIKAILEQRAADKKAQEEAEAAAKPAPETTEDILKQIRDIMKSLTPEQAAEVKQDIEKE